MCRSRTSAFLVLVSVSIAIPFLSAAQSTRSMVAIKDARIYTVSGPLIPRGTVVIRNGLIAAVGADIPVPAEATVIEAEGLTVYPGLIDSFSDAGIAATPNAPAAPAAAPAALAPAPKNTQEAVFQPPVGLNANRMLVEQIRQDGKNVEAFRSLGVTSALTVSRDGLITGQSALINTGSENNVVKGAVALHLNPAPVGGGYPGTLMGALAVLRQAFSDAEWYRQSWDRFNANPRGMDRPKYDRVLESMAPVIQGKMPTIVHANWKAQIERAVQLADELKLKVIVAGGLEAGAAAPLLQGKGIPVLVSVNYDTEKPKSGGNLPVEFDDKERKELLSNAATLQRAGVRFALHSGFAERPQQFIDNIRKTIENGLSTEDALRATTLSPAEILGFGAFLGSIEPGKIANMVVVSGDPFAKDTKVRMVFVDGIRFDPPAPDTRPAAPAAGAPTTSEATPGVPPPPSAPASPVPAKPAAVKPGSYISETPRQVVIRNATILTVSRGTIKNGSVLIVDGKIAAVGENVNAPATAKVIDATGKFVMPGIIDAHSHMAIESGINEGASPVTPNVRISDVIRDDDITIYRALAGGTTIANVLHGSANVIGGTNAVIKLKWGKPAQEFFFGAPPGIKFALGENPKRSNATQPVNNARWPATRMGVEQTLRESFTLAKRYMKEWDDFEAARRAGREATPPRRDLKLETLADVLRGKILVHVHSYVAPEIVMMLDLADEFGFKVKTLQHVLEGYKVADRIREHGAGASTFVDFWGYKVEAWDAISYNAAIMHRKGVNVSINSDSDERVRRLYEEAGRVVRYSNGEVTDEDALKMITLNPAIQLGIDSRVGSIDVGKDADLAVFNAHPLSSYAVVEMTLIDGQVYFDREEDLKLQPREAVNAND